MATAKKTTAKKTTAKQAAPKADAQETVIDQAQARIDEMTEQVTEAVDAATERVDDMVVEAIKFGRKASYMSVGTPFALRARIEDKKLFDFGSYDKFPAEAQGHGVYRIGQVEKFIEPYVKQVQDVVDPMVEKFESALPEQAQKMFADNRERFNKLMNA